jgi:hypothetical protein
VTFSGSVIAFGKLSGRISGKPLILPARHWLNLALLLAAIWFAYDFVQQSAAGRPRAAHHHDAHRAAVRRAHGHGHRRRRHAGGGVHAQQLFRVGRRRPPASCWATIC